MFYVKNWHVLLQSSSPSDACEVDSLPSVAQRGEPDGLLSGCFTVHGRSLQCSRSTTPDVTPTAHTLGFLGFIWQMFTVRLSVIIQMQNTLGAVSTALAQP